MFITAAQDERERERARTAIRRPRCGEAAADPERLETIVDTMRAEEVRRVEIAKGLGVSRQTAWERSSQADSSTRRQVVVGLTRMSALLVYIRTILRQAPAWRKNSPAPTGARAAQRRSSLIGRSL
jgi:hypothetical protein